MRDERFSGAVGGSEPARSTCKVAKVRMRLFSFKYCSISRTTLQEREDELH